MTLYDYLMMSCDISCHLLEDYARLVGGVTDLCSFSGNDFLPVWVSKWLRSYPKLCLGHSRTF